MIFEILENQIEVKQIDGENIITWSMSKENFKIAYRGFEPLPQNVIDWMNS